MRKSTVGLVAGLIVSLVLGSSPALAGSGDARRKTPKCRIDLVIGESAGERAGDSAPSLICADDPRTG